MKKTYLTWPDIVSLRPCVYLIDGGGAKLDAQGGPGKGSPFGILILAFVMG